MADAAHIELLGLPCSGKSYLAREIAESFPRVSAPLAEKRKNPSRLLKALAVVARRPSLLGILGTLGEVKPRHIAAQARACLRFVSRYGEMETAFRREGPVVVDEGVVQATWGLFLYPCLDAGRVVPRGRLERFRLWFWPSRESGFAVVYLDTPRAEILRRAASRPDNHHFTLLQLSGPSEAEALGTELLRAVLETARDSGLLLRKEDLLRGTASWKGCSGKEEKNTSARP